MNKILFVSDNNEIELVEKLTKDKSGKSLPECVYVYKYTNSKTKIGLQIFFTKSQLDRMFADGRIKILG
jgi:hypothetical protein